MRLEKQIVIMMSTENVGIGNEADYKLMLSKEGHLSAFPCSNGELIGEEYQAQHLYIIGDGEIKEGDWKYNDLLNQVWQHNRENKGLPEEIKDIIHPNTKKVIATTNISISIKNMPESFVRQYINYYNENWINKTGIITHVDLEINSNNEVIIHKIYIK